MTFLKIVLLEAAALAVWLLMVNSDTIFARRFIVARRNQLEYCVASSHSELLAIIGPYSTEGTNLFNECEKDFRILADDFLKGEIDSFIRTPEYEFATAKTRLSGKQFFALHFSEYLLKYEHCQEVLGRAMYTRGDILKKEDSHFEQQCLFTDFGISLLKIALASVRCANDIIPDGAYIPITEKRLLQEIETGSFEIIVWNEPYIP